MIRQHKKALSNTCFISSQLPVLTVVSSTVNLFHLTLSTTVQREMSCSLVAQCYLPMTENFLWTRGSCFPLEFLKLAKAILPRSKEGNVKHRSNHRTGTLFELMLIFFIFIPDGMAINWTNISLLFFFPTQRQVIGNKVDRKSYSASEHDINGPTL